TSRRSRSPTRSRSNTNWDSRSKASIRTRWSSGIPTWRASSGFCRRVLHISSFDHVAFLELVRDILPLHHLAEHGVLVIQLRRDAPGDVELAVGKLRIARVAHADGADAVLPFLRDFGDADRFAASLPAPPVHAAHVARHRIADLDDKVWIRAVKPLTVVEPLVDEFENARDGLR